MSHFDLLNYGWSVALEVREWFGGGLGADNKRYAPGAGGSKPDQPAKRNADQAESLIARQGSKGSLAQMRAAKLGACPADRGKWLKNSGTRQGNCAEMTWLACQLVRERNANNHIWMAAIVDPGDHQFCILQQSRPSENCIRDMSAPADGERSVIVDPWAGIACYNTDFRKEFTEKMEKWTSAGKRIGLVAEGRQNWIAGTDTKYLKDILTNKLTITPGYAWPA
jgi:hypothetical protein